MAAWPMVFIALSWNTQTMSLFVHEMVVLPARFTSSAMIEKKSGHIEDFSSAHSIAAAVAIASCSPSEGVCSRFESLPPRRPLSDASMAELR